MSKGNYRSCIAFLIRNETHMKHIKWMFTIALMALACNHAAWAHGSRGHSRLNLGISVGGYYNPGFYGSGFYGSNFYGSVFYVSGYYGYRSYGYPGPYFNAPIYNYPPTVIVPVTPPVYIQQEQSGSVQKQTNYWYYCQKSDGYYPYVKECPGGWLQVAPQPPAQ